MTEEYTVVTAEEGDALRAMGIEVYWTTFEWNIPQRRTGELSCVRYAKALGADYNLKFYIKAEKEQR